MKVRIHLYSGKSFKYNAPDDIFDDDQAYEDFEAQMDSRYDNDFDYAEPFRETNMELLERVCDFSINGALTQCFALQAIEAFADEVIKAGLPDDDKIRFISPEAWLACAEEWKKELSER